jgi:hypothetical protein
MSTTLVEVSSFTASVIVPEPGEDVTAASVEGPFQALANRTKYVKDNAVDVRSFQFEYENITPSGIITELALITGAGFVSAPYGDTFPVTGVSLDIAGCVAGDLLFVTSTIAYGCNFQTGSWATTRLFGTEDEGGAGETVAPISGANAIFAGYDGFYTITMNGRRTIMVDGDAKVQLYASIINAADVVKIIAIATISALRVRRL